MREQFDTEEREEVIRQRRRQWAIKALRTEEVRRTTDRLMLREVMQGRAEKRGDNLRLWREKEEQTKVPNPHRWDLPNQIRARNQVPAPLFVGPDVCYPVTKQSALMSGVCSEPRALPLRRQARGLTPSHTLVSPHCFPHPFQLSSDTLRAGALLGARDRARRRAKRGGARGGVAGDSGAACSPLPR